VPKFDPVLTVEHLSGSRKGEKDCFGPNVASIDISRIQNHTKDESRVWFPSEECSVTDTIHGQITKVHQGVYRLRAINGTIEHDGVDFIEGTLRDGDTFRLGAAKGPVLRFHIDRDTAVGELQRDYPEGNSTPTTLAQEIFRSADERGRKRWYIGIVSALLIFAMLITVVVWNFVAQQSLEDQLSDLRATTELAAKRDIETMFDTPALAQRLENSAFLIVAESESGALEPLATAWALSPDQLVTNAHVVTIIRERYSQATISVRQAFTGQTWTVVNMRTHGAYDRFQRWLERENPGIRDSSQGFRRLNLTGAYDLAILEIEGEVNEDSILEIASDETLATLAPGTPIAYAGYPLENQLGTAGQPLNPTPTVHFGYITSITDFFMTRTEFGNSQLIHHSLPAKGGTSGSPIVNSSGEVIAVLSSGSVVFVKGADGGIKRITSAIDVNYAQRIDLIQGIIAPSEILPDSAQLEALEAVWSRAALRFDDRSSSLVAYIRAQGDRDYQSTPKDVLRDTLEYAPQEPSIDVLRDTLEYAPQEPSIDVQERFFIDVSEGEPIVFMLLASDGENISPFLKFDGRKVPLDRLIRESDLYAVFLTPQFTGRLIVFIDRNTDRPLKIDYQLIRY
jgi:trypsin-like peptidase